MACERRHVIALGVLALALGQIALGLLEWPGQLRFTVSALNYLAAALAIVLMPVTLFWTARSLSPRQALRVNLGTAIVLLLPCLFLAAVTALAAPAIGKADPLYALLSEDGAGWPVYRLYRSACAAPCHSGLILQKERALVPGLKLVTPMWRQVRYDHGRVVVGPAHVQVLNVDTVIAELPK